MTAMTPTMTSNQTAPRISRTPLADGRRPAQPLTRRERCRCGGVVLLASTATGAVLPLLAYPSSAGRLRWVTADGQRFVEVALRSTPEEDLWQCHYEVCRALDSQWPRLSIAPEPCTSCGQPLALTLAVMGVREHLTCAPTATRPDPLHSQPPLSSAGAL